MNLYGHIETPVSSGMCRLTSEFVVRLGDEIGLTNWKVCGGRRGWLGDGNPQAHYWLSNGNRILDLTADQFGPGFPEVLFAYEGDPRYAQDMPIPLLSERTKEIINDTMNWDVQWRRTGGELVSAAFTPSVLNRFLRQDAAAFTLMLANEADMKPSRVGNDMRIVAGWGDGRQWFWDAAGMWYSDGVNVKPIRAHELEVLKAETDANALQDAADYARKHPEIAELINRAVQMRGDKSLNFDVLDEPPPCIMRR